MREWEKIIYINETEIEMDRMNKDFYEENIILRSISIINDFSKFDIF